MRLMFYPATPQHLAVQSFGLDVSHHHFIDVSCNNVKTMHKCNAIPQCNTLTQRKQNKNTGKPVYSETLYIYYLNQLHNKQYEMAQNSISGSRISLPLVSHLYNVTFHT